VNFIIFSRWILNCSSFIITFSSCSTIYNIYSWHSAVKQPKSQWLRAGRSGARVPAGAGNFLSTTASRLAPGPIQPISQWVPGAISLGGKAAGAWSWPLTSIYCRGQEYVELYIYSPIRLHGVVLSYKKHKDNFTFTFVPFTMFTDQECSTIHRSGNVYCIFA
jgi:hypothetical protein